jgi:hypothetical protein
MDQKRTGAEAHWDKVRSELPPMKDILARIPSPPTAVFVQVSADLEADLMRFLSARRKALKEAKA